MGQQLRALAALLENSGLIPGAHIAACNQLQLKFQGIGHPLPGHQALTWYTDMCRQNTHTHNCMCVCER